MKGRVQNSFKLNLTVMKTIGLYPFKNYPRLYAVYAYAMYIFAILPASILGFIQLLFQQDTSGVRYDDLISMVMIFLSPKLFCVVRNGHNIKKCVYYFDRKIFGSESQNQAQIVDQCVKICQRNSNVFFIGCVVSIISWCGSLFFRGRDLLPLNIWLPPDLTEMTKFYRFLYVNCVIGVIYVGLACATVDPLIAGLICHASGQVRVLKRNLEQLDEGFNIIGHPKIRKHTFIYNRIKKCLNHYSAIVRFVAEYESCFSSAILCQFMESVIVIGICCLQISKIQDFNITFLIMVNYLCFLLLQVYFYCYYGTTLIDENHSLTVAIYMSNWYKYDQKSKKALIFLMERSKRPLSVSAGKVLDLSLETFMLILKRSYSLLAVLQNY